MKVTVSSARCLLQPISCSVAELPALSEQTPPGLSSPGLSRVGCTRSTAKPVLVRERTSFSTCMQGWQTYVVPIKIFCTVFNLSILAETIIHLSCLYNINIRYMAASPLTEELFCITQTLRLHTVLVLPFLSYQSHFVHRKDVKNMIYWFCLWVHCRWSQTRYHCWMDKHQGHWLLYLEQKDSNVQPVSVWSCH